MNQRLSIEKAKRQLPLPILMARLGLSEHAKKNAFCPFHDDRKNKSFSVFQGVHYAWFWKCHAGCGSGDEITFLEKHFGVTNDVAIQQYFLVAGIKGELKQAPEETAEEEEPVEQVADFDWQRCVDATTEHDLERLGNERWYSRAFCSWLHENKLVGFHNHGVTFPVHKNGAVVSTHYKEGDQWAYHPSGLGTHPLVIGALSKALVIYLFESQWDAFALWDRCDFYQDANCAAIITRGSENGKLVAGLIASGARVYAFPQNDELKNGKRAGDEWLKDVAADAGVPVAKVTIPSQFKDMNDWCRAGATAEDICGALFRNELAATAAEAETAQEPLSPERLFDGIKTHITRYVVFGQPEHADVITLWVMHTWVADLFEYTPYVYVHSPVMRCGKTQVQKVVEPLVKNPLRTCNISESALFREIEDSHPTLLWDEIDSIFGSRRASEVNENKRALLNAGYERGIRAIRLERSGGGFEKISYDPFCPKILAGIGRLPDTIVDRSIPILIHRKLKTQPCRKYRRQDRANAKPLHDALETWSKHPELLKMLRERQPQMPEFLTDRQEDIWEPLLAIADAIGSDVPELAREAARVLCDNDDELGYGAAQLAVIRKVVGGQSRITSADLINGLWEADALPSRLMEGDEPNHKKVGHWLSKFIQSYGGEPARKLRFGEQTFKGYEGVELKQIFERYCPPEQDYP